MPYVKVILKSGQPVIVADADTGEWIADKLSTSHTTTHLRFVCKRGEQIVARFNNEDVAGYVWGTGQPQ